MVDEGETILESAIREFKEETGYTPQRQIPGFIPSVGYNSPWMCQENGKVFAFEIDKNHPSNQNPVQSLDLGELIEVKIIEDIDKGNPMEKVMALMKEKNYAICTSLQQLLNGLQFALYFNNQLLA